MNESNFWFLKLSNNATLTRVGNIFSLSSSVFDPMTDFLRDPVTISQYITDLISDDQVSILDWFHRFPEELSNRLGKIFIKRPLCLVVFRHTPSGDEYQMVFYLNSLKIEGHCLIYTLEYDKSMTHDIMLILSPNWKISITDGTLFLDQTRNMNRISSYLRTPRQMLDGMVVDISKFIE